MTDILSTKKTADYILFDVLHVEECPQMRLEGSSIALPRAAIGIYAILQFWI